MTEPIALGSHPSGFAATVRTDRWWVGPALTAIGLVAFVLYATWAAFQGAYYYAAPYLSPLYSPLLYVRAEAPGAAPLSHAWLGAWPSWWPGLLPASPALLILIFPGAFRATCYYYRKAYYRSFFGTPPGCAIGALPRKRYAGETALLLFQNLHRYALYAAIVFIAILYVDAYRAFFKEGRPGIGVGTLIMIVNPTLLGLYTFGCHSFRHLTGGRRDCFSCDGAGRLSHGLWKQVTRLNERHMEFAWMSLFWVGFTDVYIRLVAMGIIPDLNTWG